jgi:hypothetical protein
LLQKLAHAVIGLVQLEPGPAFAAHLPAEPVAAEGQRRLQAWSKASEKRIR